MADEATPLIKRLRDPVDDLLRMVGIWAVLSSLASAVVTGIWAYAASLPRPVLVILVVAVFQLVLNVTMVLQWFRREARLPTLRVEEKFLLPYNKTLHEIQGADLSPLPMPSHSWAKLSPSVLAPNRDADSLRKSPDSVIEEVIVAAALRTLHEHLVRQPGERDSLGRLLEVMLPFCVGDPAAAGTILSILVNDGYLNGVAPTSTGRFELSRKALKRIAIVR